MEDLAARRKIADLEKLVRDLSLKLERHQHNSIDGTKRLSGEIRFPSSTLGVGSGSPVKSVGYAPSQYSANDGSDVDSGRDVGGAFGAFLRFGGTSSEQVDAILSAGIFKIADLMADPDVSQLGEASGKGIDFSQVDLFHPANIQGIDNTFFYGLRNAYVSANRGAFVNGGSTLTDTTKRWGTNELAGAHITVTVGASFEDHVIVSNTATVITISGTWAAATNAACEYAAYFPVFLGQTRYPWKRLYAGDDIRWGYGPTAASMLWTFNSTLGAVALGTHLIVKVAAADPTGAQGMVYFNSSSLKLKVHDGTAWRTVTST